MLSPQPLPVIEHAGYLEPLEELPAYLGAESSQHPGQFSCCYCGVGTSAKIPLSQPSQLSGKETQGGFFEINQQAYPALLSGAYLQLMTGSPLAATGEILEGYLRLEQSAYPIKIRAFDLLLEPDGQILAQRFLVHPASLETQEPEMRDLQPTLGCARFKRALGESSAEFPLQLRPSVMDITGRRVPLFYEEALERFAHLVLEHRPPRARTLVYASGQIDYFAVFALQEVFRLLGVRNMTSNCEHDYLTGGLYKSFVAGQPGPFMTIAQALHPSKGIYLLSGWNGYISHPPVFKALLKQPDLNAWIIDVMYSESAQMIASQLGAERVILIRPGGDSQFALGIAHELLKNYPQALEQRFLAYFADPASFERFRQLALEERFCAKQVAELLAPESNYRERIEQAIYEIARTLADPEVVPVHIPSMGQGIVPHCLWANILAMLGKFGLHPDGSLAGGILQLPDQVNHETHLQGLAPQQFMGRIPIDREGIAEVTRRLGLPEDAYDKLMMISPRSTLDDAEPDTRRDLFVFFGGQLASKMMNRPRWLRKITERQTQFVVVDPAPDDFCLKYAALIMPAAPHVATAKLYQNGEWRLSLSLPRRQASSQTRSDVTIIYDLMDCVAHQLQQDRDLWLQHSALSQLSASGYLAERFGNGLRRSNGEVHRDQLWERIQAYYAGQSGNGQPLYCQPRHADGRPIEWQELLQQGSLVHGGVGSTRQVLDYDKPEHSPFQDLAGHEVSYQFFTPSESDLAVSKGLILCTGRAELSDRHRSRQSGPLPKPNQLSVSAQNPLYVSNMLAERYNLSAGDRVWITHRETRTIMALNCIPTSKLKGECVFLSLRENSAELEYDRFVNQLTSHRLRCPYTGQASYNLVRVELHKLEEHFA